jgi:hypothetical protein
MDWIGAQYGGSSLGPNQRACDWLITPKQLAEGFTNPTLMASRVVCAARSNSGEGDLIGGFGFGLIEWMEPIRAGFGTPPLSCPDVFRDQDLDWILRQVFTNPFLNPASLFTLALDEQYSSKARRRLETGSGILMVVSNSADVGVNQYAWSADARCLIKE